MRSLSWYAKRLRVMQPREIAHRVSEQVTLGGMRFRHWRGASSIVPRIDLPRFCTAQSRQLPALQWEFKPTTREIDSLLAGHYPALGHDWRWSPADAIWRQAPDTGRHWPQKFFNSIHFREGNPHGDIRIAWEPSRLQQLVTLALLAERSDPHIRLKAVVLIESQLASWVRLNPPLAGIHYISAMECALRVISVCHALDRVREHLLNAEETWAALTTLVEFHAGFIARRLSLHSSTGNHTVAEAAGLVYAAVLFPHLPNAHHWKKRGLELLEREADRQILADGSGLEQAFWYLLFIADLFGMVAELLRHYNEPVPAAIDAAVQRARSFLNAVADSLESLPPIGDADGGFALSPALRISWMPNPTRPRMRSFPDGGYTVLNAGGKEGCSVLFDHGPLGMPPSCGHGHADALAVCVAINGAPLLIDSGTYLYTGAPKWRSYFRGTRAHNTVMVNGLDQARQETAFLWSKFFHSSLVRSEETSAGTVRLLARHDGYADVDAIHWRGVVQRAGGELIVLDRLEGGGTHALELNWHLAIPPATTEGEALHFNGYSRPVSMRIWGGTSTVVSGQTDPLHGWKSQSYGKKEIGAVCCTRYLGELHHEFLTVVTFQADGNRESIEDLTEELVLLRGWIDEAKAD